MNTLLVLLLAVKLLLLNPKIQANPDYLAQATSISQAVAALVAESNTIPADATSSSPTPTYTYHHSQNANLGVSAPTVNQSTSQTPTSSASCSLTGTITSINPSGDGQFAGANVELDWTVQNPTQGNLMTYQPKNGILTSSYQRTNDWFATEDMFLPSQASTTWSYQPIYKLTLGSATCYAYFPNYREDGGTPNVGDVSTSTEPTEYQGIFSEQ